MTMTTAVAARVTAAGAVAAAAAATTATTTTTATTIASLATIEFTGAAVVLLPHGAEPPRRCRRPAVKRRPRTRRAKAGDFELHRRADAPSSSVEDVTERDI
jgi:hypothetical protein